VGINGEVLWFGDEAGGNEPGGFAQFSLGNHDEY